MDKLNIHTIAGLSRLTISKGMTLSGENLSGTNTLTHTFTGNEASFTFNFADAVGNAGTAKANVSWIDKIAPNGTISYSIMAPTNQDVLATLNVDGDGKIGLDEILFLFQKEAGLR